MLKNKKVILTIFVVGLTAYLVGLNWQEFTKIDVRYALFVAEIKQYGIGIFPTLYGKPYTDYPSLGVLLMYFSSLGGNYINLFTVAMPGAVVSTFTLILTYLLGVRISKQLGIYAVIISFLSVEYLSQVRGPSLDVYVVFATTLSFYLIYTADLDKKYLRLVLVPLCFLVGFIFRGPLGFMIPSAVVCVYYLINRKLKLFMLFSGISIILAVVLTATLMILAYLSGGIELLECFLNDQIFNRTKSNDYLLYYFIDGMGSYAIVYPLGFVALIVYLKTIVKNFRDDASIIHFVRSISAWMITILILMTIPGAKNPRYIISIIPPACLLAALIFVNYQKIPIFNKMKWFLLFICSIAPFVCMLTFLAGGIVLSAMKIEVPFNMPVTLIIFGILSFSVIVVRKISEAEYHSVALLGIIACVIVVLQIAILEPIEQRLEGSCAFAMKVEEMREKHNSQVWFFDFGPDGDELKFFANIPQIKRFIPQFIVTSIPSETGPVMGSENYDLGRVNKLKQYATTVIKYLFSADRNFPKITPRYLCYGIGKIRSLPKETIYISKAKNFKNKIPKELQQNCEIIVSGKMGHQNCVAFKKKE